MKKFVKWVAYLFFVLLVALFSSWSVWHVMAGGQRFGPGSSKKILAFAQFGSSALHQLNQWIHFESEDGRIIPNIQYKDGFTYYTDPKNLPNVSLLISSFNEKNYNPTIKLVNIKTGKIEWHWEINMGLAINYSNDPDMTKFSIMLRHPLLMPNKTIIVNMGTCLFKLDSLSRLVWINRDSFHHSIEKENDSAIWCPGMISNSALFHFNSNDTLVDNAICKVNSITGKTILKKSVAEVLKENGFGSVLYSTGFENDLIHLNEIQPALQDGKFWKKGDLLISSRHRSVVFLYRPGTNKVLWLQQGPWISQHDCSFLPNDRILIFGNDLLRFNMGGDTLVNGHNNAYIYDFNTRLVSTPFDQLFKSQNVHTRTEGRCSLLSNGDIFIDESNYGRVIIGDSLKPKLVYVQRIDKGHNIKMLNWVRVIENFK